MRHIALTPDKADAMGVAYENIAEKICSLMAAFHGMLGRPSGKRYSSLIMKVVTNYQRHACTALSIAVQFGWSAYVVPRLTRTLVRSHRQPPLLDLLLLATEHRCLSGDDASYITSLRAKEQHLHLPPQNTDDHEAQQHHTEAKAIQHTGNLLS